MNMEVTPVERLVLVVEDNAAHSRLIQDAFNQSAVRHQIVTIAEGDRALDYLHRRGEYPEAQRPDLILLELNLASKDGRDILADIKADSQLRRIPIVVLTLSASEEDVLKSYTLQGNCYVVKSSDLDQLFQIVQRIEEFWLGIVTLPLE